MPDETGRVLQPQPNHDATLTSLAIINVNWEKGHKSYLDNFVPYAVEIIRAADKPDLSARAVREGMLDDFGLNLPVQVVDALLNRARKRGLLVCEPGSRGFSLAERAEDKLPNVAQQRADCRRQQTHLVNGLVAFAETHFGFEWTTEAAEEALVNYVEGHTIPLLATSVRGKQIASDRSEPDHGTGYVVSRYISQTHDADPSGFKYLDQMVKGSMLASALYLPTPNDVQRKFKNTTLYLDTPVCLKALGHEGGEAEEAARQVLTLAITQGARLACFRHNLKEMRGILESTKQAIKRAPASESAPRGVATHFRAEGYSENEINLKVERLEQDLQKRRIEVIDAPTHVAAFTVDETALQEHLQDQVGYTKEFISRSSFYAVM